MKILLCCIFFLSGASALIFEALWFQLAGLTFGNSVWAASIVLSSFMGGLALGNGIAAFRGDKIRAPLRLYAILEFVIGISGVIIVLIFPNLSKILVPLFRLLSEQPVFLNFSRAFIAILILIVPTTAMGLTLPVLVKVLYFKRPNFGEILGALYGWNTFGAVAGVLLCELLFVKWLGIKGTGFVAAGFNFLAGIIAILLFTRAKSLGQKRKETEPFSVHLFLSFKAARILLASFFTGFIFLALEVVWFRFIILFYNAFSWNFSTILAGVLAGISLGSLCTSQLYKIKSDIQSYISLIFMLLTILVIFLYANFDMIFPFTQTFQNEISTVAVATLFLVFPVSFFSGALFTMQGKALHSMIKAETNITGLLTLANTTGGMAGALAGGYLLIPVLGIEKAFFTLALLYSFSALLVIGVVKVPKTRGNISYYRIINAVFAVFVLLSLSFFPFGLMERYYSYRPIAPYLARGEKRLVLKEGLTETIQYLQKEIAGKPHFQRLVTNSHSMSSTNLINRRYMSLFVYLPVALKNDPKDALLVCFGCGITAKTLTDTKSFERIDIVDISKDIINMSKYVFPAPPKNPINDPRVNIHIEDGRFFLLTTDHKYDLITAEPPPPKYNGVVNLYSQEYFRLIYDRLKDGGMVTYWLPVELQTLEENKAILKGFCNVFPNCSLWTGAGYQWIMMGIKNPEHLAANNKFDSLWADPLIREKMRSVGLFRPAQMSSLFIADSDKLVDWIADSPPLTDNYPQRLATCFADSDGSNNLIACKAFMNPTSSYMRFINSDQIRQIWPAGLIEEAKENFIERGVIDEIFTTNRMDYKLLHLCITTPSWRGYVPWFFGSDHQAQQIIAGLVDDKTSDHFVFKGAPDPLIAYYILKTDYLTAEKYWERAYGGGRTPVIDYEAMRIYLLCLGGDQARAASVKEEYIYSQKTGRDERRAEIEKIWKNIIGLTASSRADEN